MPNAVKNIFSFALITSLLLLSPSALAADSAKQSPASKAGKQASASKAYFAGGCFWKVQYIFSKVPGVLATKAGYMGGTSEKPSYKEVCSHKTGHAEAVEVDFDEAKVSYKKLLQVFFANHDPTTVNRQGPDIGTQYRSAIFCANLSQKKEALAYINELNKEHKFKSSIVTKVEDAAPFFSAEDYHQDYFLKHGVSCE